MHHEYENRNGETADAVELVKNECDSVKEITPSEMNQLAVQIVTASNIYDSAALISEAIEYLNEKQLLII